MAIVKDNIGRPLDEDDTVFIIGTSETGRVVGPTPGRRTMVDVQRGDGSITAFYGKSLYLRRKGVRYA